MDIIAEGSTIESIQERFERCFLLPDTKLIPCNIGYPGGSLDANVLWSDSLCMWFYSRRLDHHNKYWNAFGFEYPSHIRSLSITCEINIPIEGINRRLGGAFIKDKSDNIFIIHRGNIGGGRKGIGKSLFRDNYNGEWIDFNDGSRIENAAVVCELNSADIVLDVKRFIIEVNRIKNVAKC